MAALTDLKIVRLCARAAEHKLTHDVKHLAVHNMIGAAHTFQPPDWVNEVLADVIEAGIDRRQLGRRRERGTEFTAADMAIWRQCEQALLEVSCTDFSLSSNLIIK
jgi:hypothetical protein